LARDWIASATLFSKPNSVDDEPLPVRAVTVRDRRASLLIEESFHHLGQRDIHTAQENASTT